MNPIVLYDYWRSAASYRVRIALLFKGLDFDVEPVDLLKGEHQTDLHLTRNPQGLVPALDIDGHILTQSLAIIDYLDARFPDHRLIPTEATTRAQVLALSHAIAMDIHPICNLGVVNHVSEITRGGEPAKADWMQTFIRPGLVGFEAMLGRTEGPFCHGKAPSMADCCLIPQLYNADRWGVDYADLKRISGVAAACKDVRAFVQAYPDNYRPSE